MPEATASLESKLGYSATAFCGGHSRTLGYIGTLGSAWAQPDTGASGPCRADVVEVYRKGLDDLRNRCRKLFAEMPDSRNSLVEADNSDALLAFLNGKKIDGVCREAPLDKYRQYAGILENYNEDRRFFVESCYVEWLKEKLDAKKSWRVWSFLGNKFFLHVATAAVVIAALGIPGYFVAKKVENTRQEFYSALNDTKKEFRQMLEPKYIDEKVQEYICSPEGQKTAELLKAQLRGVLQNEGISEKKIDEVVERKILPALAEMRSSENNRELAREIVKEIFGTVTPEMLDKILKILENNK